MEKALKTVMLLITWILMVFATSCSNDPNITPETATSAVPSDATAIMDFTKLSELPTDFTGPTYNYAATLADDSTYGKVLDLSLKEDSTGAGYCSATITFSSPIDLSGKTLYVVMKGSDTLNTTAASGDYPSNTDDIKFGVYSSTTAASETGTIYPLDDTQFATYSKATGNFVQAYGADTSADFTAVTSLKISFQTISYNLQIAAIYYK